LKYDWKRKRRIEIHTQSTEIPHIVIWRIDKGFIKPTSEELKTFFQEEFRIFKEITQKISKRQWSELPGVYKYVAQALESKLEVSKIAPTLPHNLALNIETLYEKAMSLLKKRLEELNNIISKKLPGDINTMRLINEQLDSYLKEIITLSYIINEIHNPRVLTNIKAESKGTTTLYFEQLKFLIAKRSVRNGLRKNILIKLFHQLTLE